MIKKILYLFMLVIFLLIYGKAQAWDYEVDAHWTSEEPWGSTVSDFNYNTHTEVYTNVAAPLPYGVNPPSLQLRWFKPDGERELNLGTNITMVFRYEGGAFFGIQGSMVIDEICREEGQWRVEHWAYGFKDGFTGWHYMSTAYFNLPLRTCLEISPKSFDGLALEGFFDIPGTYTCGLAFDGIYLWNADCWYDELYKLDISSGDVVDYFFLPGGDGLAFDGTYLWSSNYVELKIDRLDISSGSIVDSFDSPCDDPSGLAFDGTHLWLADLSGSSFGNLPGKIYKLDTAGTLINSFDSPGPSPSGLTFDGSRLWNADLSHDKIYKLETSGIIGHGFDTPGPTPQGLAFDGTCLWVADDREKKIYKLRPPTPVSIGSSKRRIFTVSSSGGLELEIGTLSISGPNSSEFTIENDNCSNKTLASKDSCTLDIVFSPSSAGDVIANLKIPSNDLTSPKLVELVAEGVDLNGCQCDFETDGDVDGSDLAAYIAESAGISIDTFAANFGRINCP